ncbi:Prefoldin subunit [Entamoeba marina]
MLKCLGKSIDFSPMNKYELSQLNQQFVADIEYLKSQITFVDGTLQQYNENLKILNDLLTNKYSCKNTIIQLTPLLTLINGRVIVHIGQNYYISKILLLESTITRFFIIQKRKKQLERVLNDRNALLKQMETVVKKLVAAEH